jgi:hypothetical protein
MNDETHEKRFSPTQIAIGVLGAAIILLVIMLFVGMGDVGSG